MGHSSGEIAAVYAAGALDLETCMSLAYCRGVASTALTTEYPDVRGAMLALGASEKGAAEFLETVNNVDSTAHIACINSPSSVTISGDEDAIIRLQKMAS